MRAVNILWETDNIDLKETPMDLPKEVEIPQSLNEEDIADYLSDNYNYCVKGYQLIKDIDLGIFTVEVTLQTNGNFDVYIAHEGSSGEHYTDVTADRIGKILAGDIECIAEAYTPCNYIYSNGNESCSTSSKEVM